MSFLTPHPRLESWLCRASSRVRSLNQREYQKLVAAWRAQFKSALVARDCVFGARAEQGALALLPADAFVFSMPGDSLLPSGTDSKLDPTYGYEVDALATIDFAVANPADAIFVDRAMSFTCLCTHEAGALAEPILARSGARGPA